LAEREEIVMGEFVKGLKSSNCAVWERRWTVAERMKEKELLELPLSGGMVRNDGTGTVMLRPDNAFDNAEFPDIDSS
jgi:hypothetical protein